MSVGAARRRLDVDLLMAVLFSSGVSIPDVFLFNNPSLHEHILSGRCRSLFSEAVNENVIRLYARTRRASGYLGLLSSITDDTLEITSLRQPIAIQNTALLVAERMTHAASRQIFGFSPVRGRHSWGQALARLFEEHSYMLVHSESAHDRELGLALYQDLRDVERHLRHFDHAGLRRSTLVSLAAEQRMQQVISTDEFLHYPYKVMLSATSRLDRRASLRREMLEVTLLYHVNLARQYGSIVYWPNSIRGTSRPDVVVRARERGAFLTPYQEKVTMLRATLPPVRRLLRLGPDVVSLRKLGTYYFEDLMLLEKGEPVPLEQVQEDMASYARSICDVVRGGTEQLLVVASGVASVAGVASPAAALMGGGLTSFSALFHGRRQRINLTLQRMEARYKRQAVYARNKKSTRYDVTS